MLCRARPCYLATFDPNRLHQNLSRQCKTEQTAVLITGDDSADVSVVKLELREVRPESYGLTRVSYWAALSVMLDEYSVHTL